MILCAGIFIAFVVVSIANWRIREEADTLLAEAQTVAARNEQLAALLNARAEKLAIVGEIVAEHRCAHADGLLRVVRAVMDET